MGNIINELGNIYGYLTVIEKSPISDKEGRTQWICQCKCGNTITVAGKYLRNGNIKSCGCISKSKCSELGKKYNLLTVLEYSHRNERGELIWKCQCDCGNIAYVKTSSLRSGHTKSCGCLYSPDLTGKKFGLLTVIEKAYSKNNYIYWKCKCDCGREHVAMGNNLKRGNTSSCGCINYSIGENNIKKWLESNNIKYQKEWVIPNTYYRFDFAIFDKNDKLVLFIEYDGEQHFNDIKGTWNSLETLSQRQQRDKIKNNYAIQNNISLVRIPYWERDNINTDTVFNPKYFVHISNNKE